MVSYTIYTGAETPASQGVLDELAKTALQALELTKDGFSGPEALGAANPHADIRQTNGGTSYDPRDFPSTATMHEPANLRAHTRDGLIELGGRAPRSDGPGEPQP